MRESEVGDYLFRIFDGQSKERIFYSLLRIEAIEFNAKNGYSFVMERCAVHIEGFYLESVGTVNSNAYIALAKRDRVFETYFTLGKTIDLSKISAILTESVLAN